MRYFAIVNRFGCNVVIDTLCMNIPVIAFAKDEQGRREAVEAATAGNASWSERGEAMRYYTGGKPRNGESAPSAANPRRRADNRRRVRPWRRNLARLNVHLVDVRKPLLRCRACGSEWTPEAGPGETLPRWYWRCPRQCNATPDRPRRERSTAPLIQAASVA